MPLVRQASVRHTAAMVRAARRRVTVNAAAIGVTADPDPHTLGWALLIDLDGAFVHQLPNTVPIANVAAARIVVPLGRYAVRACDWCGGDVIGAARKGRLYCSGRCRQAAYRARKGAASHRLDARLRTPMLVLACRSERPTAYAIS